MCLKMACPGRCVPHSGMEVADSGGVEGYAPLNLPFQTIKERTEQDNEYSGTIYLAKATRYSGVKPRWHGVKTQANAQSS